MDQRPVSIYAQLGGEDAVRRLVDIFYDIVESDPAAKPVHDLHLGLFGMGHVRTAQFEFLCGFFGGPKYYVERMGHSNLRAIHEHLSFGQGEARVWLSCMERALDESGVPAPLKQKIMSSFTIAAGVLVEDSMRRRVEGVQPASRPDG
jgi:hemoglobin